MTTSNAKDSSTEKENADQMGDAFDEAAAKHDDGSDAGSDEGGGTQASADGSSDHHEDNDSDNKTDTRSADNAGEDGQDDAGSDDTGEQSDQDWKVLYAKEKQRTKSWEGRISKAEREARELREENERLKASTKPADTGKSDTATADKASDPMAALDADERAALAELEADYPVIAKALKTVTKVATAASATVPKDVPERVQRIEKRIEADEQAAVNAHFQALEQAHPTYAADYIESGELEGWIRTLPYDAAVKAMKVYKNGSTQQVIGLFDDFAESTGRKKRETPNTNHQPQPGSRQSKLESLTGVRRNSGKPAASGGQPGKDDFDGAFDRAAAQHQR